MDFEFPDENNVEENIDKQEQINKGKKIIEEFSAFVDSEDFKKKVKEKSEKYDLPPKKVADGFVAKVFGTISDTLGVVLNVVDYSIHGLINFLAFILNSAVDLILKVATGLVRIITFNKTAKSN